VEPLLSLLKRPQAHRLAVEVEEIEQEKDERIALAGIRRVLDQAEMPRTASASTS
jgi:hypothetical protein